MKDRIYSRLLVDFPGFALNVNLTLPGRGISALFGQSGSGKTTVLRCIAGLERARHAYIEVNGAIWQDDDVGRFLPTHQRSLGYVFQEANLFPHLTVQRNLEYGRKRARNKPDQAAYDQAIDLLGIGHLMARLPEKLSGGERQRVAIARALLTDPDILLMDEPLAALDMQRKQELLPYFERLHCALDIPIVYVSHQPDEVVRLADHMVLLEHGKVTATGSAYDVLTRLGLPTTQHEDASAIITATVGQHDTRYHLTRMDFAGGAIQVAHRDLPIGQQVRLKLYARNVSLTLNVQKDSSILNHIPATVVDMAEAASPTHVMVRLDANGTTLLARITRLSWDTLGLQPGSRVYAQVKSAALLL